MVGPLFSPALFLACALLETLLDTGHAQLVVPYVNNPVYPLSTQWNPNGMMYGSPTQGIPSNNALWGSQFSGRPSALPLNAAQPSGFSYPLPRAGVVPQPTSSSLPPAKPTSDESALVKNAFDMLISNRFTQKLPVLTRADSNVSRLTSFPSTITTTASPETDTEADFLETSSARTRRKHTTPYLRNTTNAFSYLDD